MERLEIPIFFAVDDAYIPLLEVTVQSLVETKNEKDIYRIRILYTNVNEKNKKEIMKYSKDNVKIEFVNVQKELERLQGKLLVRDYYSNATYYRILIPNIYKQYDKVIYLDADIVILEDIAELYKINMEDSLLAGVPEPWFEQYNEFQEYAEKIIGVTNYKKYINVGVLLMNLKELRAMDFENVFLNLLDVVKYTFLQDEDYINRICRGKIKYIDPSWNVCGYLYNAPNPKIIHYTLFKPWQKKNMKNNEYFWNIAKKTNFYELFESLKTEDSELNAEKSLSEFRRIAQYETSCAGNV